MKGLSKTARAVWDMLPDETKEDLVMSAWDLIRGKPPRALRLARLNTETLKAKIEVARRFAK